MTCLVFLLECPFVISTALDIWSLATEGTQERSEWRDLSMRYA